MKIQASTRVQAAPAKADPLMALLVVAEEAVGKKASIVEGAPRNNIAIRGPGRTTYWFHLKDNGEVEIEWDDQYAKGRDALSAMRAFNDMLREKAKHFTSAIL